MVSTTFTSDEPPFLTCGPLLAEFEDDPRCIYTSQHYISYLSPVFESVLLTAAPVVEAADHITQRGSRKKHQAIQGTSASGDDRVKSYKLQGNEFENVLDFLAICYVNDDDQVRATAFFGIYFNSGDNKEFHKQTQYRCTRKQFLKFVLRLAASTQLAVNSENVRSMLEVRVLY
jgi:hypothetical protein